MPVTTGTGSIPESARGWGFDGATPRMAAIRDEIIRKFGAPTRWGACAPATPESTVRGVPATS